MAKYTKEVADKIVALIEEDNYTVTAVCEIVGINRKTFYRWKESYPSFAGALKEAMEIREERIRFQARKAMQKKLESYKQIETKTVYTASKDDGESDKLYIKEYTVKEKFCLPDTSAILFTLSGNEKEKKQNLMLNPESKNTLMSITVDSEKTKHDLRILKDKLSAANHA